MSKVKKISLIIGASLFLILVVIVGGSIFLSSQRLDGPKNIPIYGTDFTIELSEGYSVPSSGIYRLSKKGMIIESNSDNQLLTEGLVGNYRLGFGESLDIPSGFGEPIDKLVEQSKSDGTYIEHYTGVINDGPTLFYIVNRVAVDEGDAVSIGGWLEHNSETTFFSSGPIVGKTAAAETQAINELKEMLATIY